jgi:hypothetical protein
VDVAGESTDQVPHRHSIATVALGGTLGEKLAAGICLDSFHILARGSSLDEIATIPSGKLFMLQLADAPRLRMGQLQWSRHFRCFPGQGSFDLESFLGRVLAAGYGGPLSLEIFKDIFRQADPFHTAVDGRRSLLWLEERVSARAERFNAPPEITHGLQRLLAGLGLRRTGQHRTKPVELWEAGGARILLNSGRRSQFGGFAVAAVGLEVTDAALIARRATALRAPIVPRHRDWERARPRGRPGIRVTMTCGSLLSGATGRRGNEGCGPHSCRRDRDGGGLAGARAEPGRGGSGADRRRGLRF